jgi:nitrogen regulatory protein PII
MKSILITFNQAFDERIKELLDKQMLRGFTYWENVQGRGSKDGEPHYGSHAWPTLNSAIISVIDDEKVDKLLASLRALDEETPMLGLRAFVWNVEKAI